MYTMEMRAYTNPARTLWQRILFFIQNFSSMWACTQDLADNFDIGALEYERDSLRDECARLQNRVERLQIQANNREMDLNKATTKLSLLRLPEVIQALSEKNYQMVYDIIAPFLDGDGFRLYAMAQELTGVDIHSYFYTEDNMGRFEEANGYELMDWLECAAYGSCEWNLLECPGGYQMSKNRVIHKDTAEYKAYRQKLVEATVKKLLDMN